MGKSPVSICPVAMRENELISAIVTTGFWDESYTEELREDPVKTPTHELWCGEKVRFENAHARSQFTGTHGQILVLYYQLL